MSAPPRAQRAAESRAERAFVAVASAVALLVPITWLARAALRDAFGLAESAVSLAVLALGVFLVLTGLQRRARRTQGGPRSARHPR